MVFTWMRYSLFMSFFGFIACIDNICTVLFYTLSWYSLYWFTVCFAFISFHFISFHFISFHTYHIHIICNPRYSTLFMNISIKHLSLHLSQTGWLTPPIFSSPLRSSVRWVSYSTVLKVGHSWSFNHWAAQLEPMEQRICTRCPTAIVEL